MTEPKVSERMAILVGNVGHTAYAYGQDPRDMNMADCSNAADHELLSAIAEIEQRAEKWKAVALTHVALMQSLGGSVDEINAAAKKTVDACKALGNEWDEAVR